MKINTNKKAIIFGLLIVVVMFSIIVSPYLISNLPLEIGGDLTTQHYQFYVEFKSMMTNFIENKVLPFYAWDVFLGNNFYASKAYYMMGDIYAYIGLLFNVHYYSVYMIQNFLKIVVSFISFYYLSRTFRFDYKVSMLLGIGYAFSSWFFFFINQVMFVSFYSFVPLYFMGIELYLRKNRYSLFIISTTILLLTNYYLFFAISLFSPIYYLIRYYIINDDFKNIISKTIKLIVIYMIGVMITAVLILPAVLYIIEADRVGGFSWLFRYSDIKIYLHQLQAMFVPSQLIIYQDYNIFETGHHNTRELCMYSAAVFSILVPQILSDKDKKYKKSMMIMYLVLILLLIIPSGSMALLGFSDYSFRWTFIIIVINLLVSGRYLNNFNLINKKNLVISLSIIILILLFNYPLTLFITGRISDFSLYFVEYIISLLMILVYIIVFLFIKKNSINKIIIITIIELLIANFITMGILRMDRVTSWESVEYNTEILPSDNRFNYYLDELKNENYSQYYRVYIPVESVYHFYSRNMGMIYDVRGVTTYDSTYSPSFYDMNHISYNIMEDNADWVYDIRDVNLLNFLSVKYAVVLDESELPKGDYTLVNNNYYGDIRIYENNDYRSVGNTYNQILTYNDIWSNDYEESVLLDNIICYKEDYDEIYSYLGDNSNELTNILYGDNSFYGELNTDEKGFMIVSLPYDEGWNIRVNDNDVKMYKVNGGMIGIPVEKGNNIITMNFIPVGFKTGLVISFVGVILTGYLIFKKSKNNKY
jgi:uncharacterized membrane protein YfhO